MAEEQNPLAIFLGLGEYLVWVRFGTSFDADELIRGRLAGEVYRDLTFNVRAGPEWEAARTRLLPELTRRLGELGYEPAAGP